MTSHDHEVQNVVLVCHRFYLPNALHHVSRLSTRANTTNVWWTMGNRMRVNSTKPFDPRNEDKV